MFTFCLYIYLNICNTNFYYFQICRKLTFSKESGDPVFDSVDIPESARQPFECTSVPSTSRSTSCQIPNRPSPSNIMRSMMGAGLVPDNASPNTSSSLYKLPMKTERMDDLELEKYAILNEDHNTG